MEHAFVTGSLDDLRSSDIRFLEEASRCGKLHIFLWSDQLVRSLEGVSPSFPKKNECISSGLSVTSIKFTLSIN